MLCDELENIRRGFEKLKIECEQAAASMPFFTHQFIYSDCGEVPMSRGAWGQFIDAEAGKLVVEGQWEQWDVHGDGRICSRFYGFGSREALAVFRSLASAGARLLGDLYVLANTGEGLKGRVEVQVPIDRCDYLDWLVAVHRTAFASPTIFLQTVCENWRRPEAATCNLEAECARIEELLAQKLHGADGPGIPAHPWSQALQQNIFKASAEAIGLWLNPNDAEIIHVGVWDSLPPVQIPEAVDELAENTVTVLSDQDIQYRYVRAATSTADLKPRWDNEHHELWVDDSLIKQYNQPAGNQIKVLTCFEEDKWSRRTDSPFPDPKVLSDTVAALNRNQMTPGILKFRCDGLGKGVLWEVGVVAGMSGAS